MSACETCWNKAFTISRRTGQSQVEVYRQLIQEPCEEVFIPPKCFDCGQVVGSDGDVGDTYAFCDDQCRQAFMAGLL